MKKKKQEQNDILNSKLADISHTNTNITTNIINTRSKRNTNDVKDKKDDEGNIQELDLDSLVEFENHPFQILDNEDMTNLCESIKLSGVLEPITVRCKDNVYEIISGHRRVHASKLLEKKTIIAIIKDYTDEEAIIAMVDSNLRREELLPSERAKSYNMLLEAKKKLTQLRKKNGAQIEHQTKKKKSIEQIAEDVGESRAQVQRYIRLNKLNNELLELVDTKKLPFNAGVELSYLKVKEQKQLAKKINELSTFPSASQCKDLREHSKSGSCDDELITTILSDKKTKQSKITFATETISEYFEKDTSIEDMKETIMNLLSKWSKTQ